MKFELKNIKHLEKASFETNNYAADLFIDGVKRAVVHNGGMGGNTSIMSYTAKDEEAVKLAVEYCKTLPEVDCGDFSFPNSLDFLVDTLLEDWLFEKDVKKYSLKGVVFGNRETGLQSAYWKGQTISTLLANPKGIELLRKTVSELKEKGEKILNTNLPESVLA